MKRSIYLFICILISSNCLANDFNIDSLENGTSVLIYKDSLSKYVPVEFLPILEQGISDIESNSRLIAEFTAYNSDDTLYNYLQFKSLYEEFLQKNYSLNRNIIDTFVFSYDDLFQISKDSAVVFDSKQFKQAYSNYIELLEDLVRFSSKLLKENGCIRSVGIDKPAENLLLVWSGDAKTKGKPMINPFEQFIARFGLIWMFAYEPVEGKIVIRYFDNYIHMIYPFGNNRNIDGTVTVVIKYPCDK